MIVSLILVVAFGVVCFLYKKLWNQLQAKNSELLHLANKLKATRKELGEINSRRKKLLSASTQALIIVERDYKISSANKVARRFFGKPDKTTTLMTWTRQHRLQDMVTQLFEGEHVAPLTLTLGDQTLEAHARAIKKKKQAIAVALSIHDITRLEQLSRARRDFVANISHELRTPLASIQLLTDTLLNGGLENETVAHDLTTKIAVQADVLSQLAQEVLDLSLIESGKVPLKMSSQPLRPIGQAQLTRLLPQAERKGIMLKLDIDENEMVLVDETMIGRVISNLMHNAIKFTERGSVTLSAKKLNGDLPAQLKDESFEGDWIKVSVADTGVGIPEEELPRIFERFYKIDRARNRKDAGTGLGLAIVKHVVEAHGGVVWAEQNGEGVTFNFIAPTDPA